MTVDYANPSACYCVAILLPLLGTIAVIWRFILRFKVVGEVKIDDWLCIPALIFTWGCGIVIIVGTAQDAVGQHSSPQSIKAVEFQYILQQTIIHKCSYAFNILNYCALGCIKLSFLFFYRRIFRGKFFNIVSWVLIVITALWMVLFALVLLFMCGHYFNDIWGPLQQFEEHCLNVFDQNYAGSIMDVILDGLIVLLPIVMVWKLKMPVKHKLSVCAIFLTASLSIACAALRLYINVGLLSQNDLTYSTVLGVSSTDEIGMSTIQLFWSMIEIGVAMVVVCMPALHLGPAFSKARRWVTGGFRKRMGSSSGTSGFDSEKSGDRSSFDDGEDVGGEKGRSKRTGDNSSSGFDTSATSTTVREPYEKDGKPKSLRELDGKPQSIRELEAKARSIRELDSKVRTPEMEGDLPLSTPSSSSNPPTTTRTLREEPPLPPLPDEAYEN